jgi:hypothetical protein
VCPAEADLPRHITEQRFKVGSSSEQIAKAAGDAAAAAKVATIHVEALT